MHIPKRPPPHVAGLVLAIALPLCCIGSGLAAEQVPWSHRGPEDGLEGVRAAKVHAEWPLRKPEQPVIVAVIDSGIAVTHPDLAGAMWTNQAEADGETGFDDDGNGYVDDLHGWNFLGSADGSQQVSNASRVLTRELVRLRQREQAGELDQAASEQLTKLEKQFAATQERARKAALAAYARVALLDYAWQRLQEAGVEDRSAEALKAFTTDDPLLDTFRRHLMANLSKEDELLARAEQGATPLTIWYNDRLVAAAGDRAVIEQDGRTASTNHGNPVVSVPGTDYHGTHVAGIISAVADNDLGVRGIAPPPYARIMALRAVPNGDEYDVDIAAAIRYAVANGAKVINMSFGKPFSGHKDLVDAAARFAADKDVLLLTGSGNSGLDVGANPSYPNPHLADEDGTVLANWLLVGATANKRGKGLVASFSNYHPTRVHLLAPGVNILSTVPGDGYQASSGTSMACPTAAGVAALVRSQYPQLTAVQVAEILIESSRRYDELKVRRPGRGKNSVTLDELARSAGIVDAWAALEAAQALAESPAEEP